MSFNVHVIVLFFHSKKITSAAPLQKRGNSTWAQMELSIHSHY